MPLLKCGYVRVPHHLDAELFTIALMRALVPAELLPSKY